MGSVVDMGARTGASILFAALQKRDFETTDLLLQEGADLFQVCKITSYTRGFL